MAGKKEKEEIVENKEVIEERNVKVKSKINLKYDKDAIKAGEEFFIRISDIEVVKEYGEILSNIEELKKAASEEKNKNENGAEE